MTLRIESVSVTNITRYINHRHHGLIAADVQFRLEDGESGVKPVVDINVDLPDVDDLSFAQIEERSIETALGVLTFAFGLTVDDLVHRYRRKFVDEDREHAEE